MSFQHVASASCDGGVDRLRGLTATRRHAVVLVLLVVLGTWLRFHHIQRNSLWADELFTVGIALYHPLIPREGEAWYRHTVVQGIRDGDSWWTAKLAEQSPPLHDLLAKASIHLLGPTELGARLPGALAACLLLLVGAALAWRARDAGMRRVLTWTLLVLACNPVLIVYAKDGRAYSLAVTLLGIGALQWMLRWRDGARGWRAPSWGESMPLALACLTHYNAAPVVALLLVPDAVMAVWRGSLAAAGRFVGMAAIVLPWMAFHAETILFTAQGGASWGLQQQPLPSLAGLALVNALAALHWPWLILLWGVAAGVFGHAVGRAPHPLPPRSLLWSLDARRFAVVVAFAIAAILIDSVLAAKAGMMSVRYFIFALPFAAVAAGLLLARLRHPALVATATATLLLLSLPFLRPPWMSQEDFRSMARNANWELDARTPVLFPWEPNRLMYRASLQQMTGRDLHPQMVSTSFPADAPRLCDQLADAPHVVVVGHAMNRDRTNDVYDACGWRWPHRYVQEFHTSYAEHWYRRAPAITPPR